MRRGGGFGGGRGGGGGMSINKEQLNALGISGNEPMPGPVSQPPPLFPPLEKKPIPLADNIDRNYMLIVKQVFLDNLHLSGAYLKAPEEPNNKSTEELNKLVAQLPTVKENYDWKMFPAELRLKLIAKRIKKENKKELDIKEKLEHLEKIEETQQTNKEDNEEENNENPDEEVEEVDEDEEMDDGIDYANNYFDNGEAYEDEDDNLDDGPIY